MQRAVLIMFLAMSLIPAGDSAGKLLTGTFDIAPIFVAWSRFAVGAVMVLPFVSRNAWALLLDWRIWARAATLALGITSIQMALQVEQIATVFAAFFVGPLISYVLAVIFLREPVTRMRSALVLLGFIGVLIVVRPGLGASVGVLWALAAGACYGVFLTMSRWLGHLGSPIALTFTQLFIAALLLLPLGIVNLPAFSGAVTALTATSALCSMLGNLLLLYAYKFAPATRVAPLVYFQLVAAVGLGWIIFADLPDAWTWTGLVVVLVAGLASARLR
ncbi:DMT family transporter [Sulfitobacter sp. F26169L]|uniref:DMT family transporter n=1 Tax=Sulfitobacter sp. F26169L TaxID=2996015 RepID=UPI002260A79E|nr:DMT family transporter [Sulfitobacter sp. F26169L]MCX7567844.1 DMT family transporter [Sulfitobacter sp. F26169L]